ncbi:pre-peptidase [Desulfobotulus alkaliphilus]|uniref:Pre-peptidase n=1 Tax=Desulfobotulus alkaliphilus TaxID=622671 RepID=A0A562RS14_9BACT|nr:DUF1566 domain-containing protein [Desulfobotulus alkaliphilus]TWI71693.1 pre-peptidase [Desulfobotulus alkaliphilus]
MKNNHRMALSPSQGMESLRAKFLWVLALSFLFLFSGCGGGGSDSKDSDGGNTKPPINETGHTVTPSAGVGGIIDPDTPQTVNHGATTSFTITPDTGYGISSVTGCGGTLSGNTYTTGAITGACTVTASFSQFIQSSYTVSASAGEGGSISPSSRSVNHGSSTSFTVTPDTGYGISSVTGCGGRLSSNTYIITNTFENCTVTALFEWMETIPLQNGLGITNLSAVPKAQRIYEIDLPEGSKDLIFRLYGGSGDADLYVRQGVYPTLSEYDCRSEESAGNEKICHIKSPQAGIYYVLLYTDSGYEDLTIEAAYQSGGRFDTVEIKEEFFKAAEGGVLAMKEQVKLEVKPDSMAEDAEIKMKHMKTRDGDVYVNTFVLEPEGLQFSKDEPAVLTIPKSMAGPSGIIDAFLYSDSLEGFESEHGQVKAVPLSVFINDDGEFYVEIPHFSVATFIGGGPVVSLAFELPSHHLLPGDLEFTLSPSSIDYPFLGQVLTWIPGHVRMNLGIGPSHIGRKLKDPVPRHEGFTDTELEDMLNHLKTLDESSYRALHRRKPVLDDPWSPWDYDSYIHSSKNADDDKGVLIAHDTGYRSGEYYLGAKRFPGMTWEKRIEVVRNALVKTGAPYTFVGNNEDRGYSCSGFAGKVYEEAGSKITDNARTVTPLDQYVAGSLNNIDRVDVLEGELLDIGVRSMLRNKIDIIPGVSLGAWVAKKLINISYYEESEVTETSAAFEDIDLHSAFSKKDKRLNWEAKLKEAGRPSEWRMQFGATHSYCILTCNDYTTRRELLVHVTPSVRLQFQLENSNGAFITDQPIYVKANNKWVRVIPMGMDGKDSKMAPSSDGQGYVDVRVPFESDTDYSIVAGYPFSKDAIEFVGVYRTDDQQPSGAVNLGKLRPQTIAAPSAFMAIFGSESVALSWNAISGATGYALYYGRSAGINPDDYRTYDEKISLGNVTAHTVQNLNNGTRYYFVIRALVSGSESSNSNEVSATPNPTAFKFMATINKYNETEDNNQACKNEFGSAYRLADWNDVVAYYDSGKSMDVFFDRLAMPSPESDDRRSLNVSRNGHVLYGSRRHYFITRHDHNLPGHYLSHANIDNHLIDLGSWDGARHALCYTENTSLITGRLNDTGIDWWADETTNNITSPVATHPGQDADFGRDAAAREETLQKVGAGAAGFDFTKLGANGQPLAIQNNSWSDTGSEAAGTKWSCVKDNHTGLIWEVKVNDPEHLRHMSHSYSWYNPVSGTNGGHAGYQNRGSCKHSDCDTKGFVEAVNEAGLCGARDWRMPTRKEILSIVNYGRRNPSIDTEFFPNTQSSWFWSSSPRANVSGRAWNLAFASGHVNSNAKYLNSQVRLVRGGQ